MELMSDGVRARCEFLHHSFSSPIAHTYYELLLFSVSVVLL